MSSKHTRIFKNETISLTEGIDGFWLYDTLRGMNLAMRAKTEQDAFVQALTYYQKRYTEVCKDYKELRSKVDEFIENTIEKDE